jgi:flavodoxin II
MKIGLFYGSTTCYTEMAAEKIAQCIGEERVDMFDIKDTPLSKMDDYELLVLGISTWDFGELQEDWEGLWDDIDDIDLDGKVVALFGLGDQIGYTEWFMDALGMLHEKAVVQGAATIGYWPNQGYEFEKSLALTQDRSHFLGLALDDESQYEQSQQRIKLWCEQVIAEIDEIFNPNEQ